MNAVIGTAGHVDHGKSSLIKALTGIHPSRLPQELAREMTIELGFAHFITPTEDKIGIIDVPGHERFIRNMVSAVWGLDLVLFVVAADEGWANLSSEHLRIVSAMGIKQHILVLTKTDLVDDTRLADVENEALEHFLMSMDTLPDVVHVSAHTGQGIEQLKQLIIQKVATIEKRQNLDPDAHIYVDRVFSINGIGTTITGTLRGGDVKENDVLTLYPAKMPVKVRSLQSYHTQLNHAEPYTRTAIGLKQINKKLVSRGSCLVKNADAISVSTDWLVRLNPQFTDKLKKQGVVEVALGTAHVLAKYYIYANSQLVRLQLEQAIPAFWGQSLLLIQHGGSHIVGAGDLVWTTTLDRTKRQKLEQTLSTLTINREDLAATKIILELAINGYTKQNAKLSLSPEVIQLGEWWISQSSLTELRTQCDNLLNQAINAISVEELARHSHYPTSLVELLVEQVCQSGEWQKINGAIIAAMTRDSDEIPANQQLLLETIEQTAKLGFNAAKSEIAGIRRLLRALTERDLIVPTENDLFFSRPIYDQIVSEIMQGRNLKDTFSVGDARDCTGISRKQLIPLLNRLERDGWVKRIGDARQVCKVFK